MENKYIFSKQESVDRDKLGVEWDIYEVNTKVVFQDNKHQELVYK